MTIVFLTDGTSYCVDTNKSYNAESVVEYKLKDRRDFRQIASYQVMEECIMDKNSKYYNSNNPYDGVPLKAKNGWSYKWSDTSSLEFR